MGTVIQVDDSETMCSMIKMCVGHKYNLIQGRDGEQGFELFKNNNNDNLRLIITDINMPKKDGLQLIKQIREINKDVPILVLTTESEEEKRKLGQQYGANGWIVKPFKPTQFIDIVEKIL